MITPKSFALLTFLLGYTTLIWGHALPAVESRIEGRITGGSVAADHQFPYQVGLSIEFLAGQFTWCGGSLISTRWVITAAHCVDDIIGITVYLGSTKRLEPTKTLKVTTNNIHAHPAWNSKSLINDIALLYLPSVVKESAGIRPIALPKMTTTYASYAYSEAVATGWGRISDSSSNISNELHYVIRFVETNEECKYSYGSSIRSTNICIDTTGGKSTCTGDSGGPLALQNGADSFVLIGISSFGKSAGCTKGFPAVFTRITSYLDWINEVAGVAYV